MTDTTHDVSSIMARYVNAIDQEIEAELQEELDDWLRNVLKYHFGWLDQHFQPVAGGNSGKKLRPIMALLAYQGAMISQGADPGEAIDLSPALPLAACIEMIHNYSLIHDDIEDEDEVRRGRATLWALWGRAKAINVGDCLNMLAYRKLLRSAEREVEADRLVRLTAAIVQTSIRLTVGQDADIGFEGHLDVTPEMYLKMIGGKSAALINCSVYTGALVALDPRQYATQLTQYARFGEQIGLGFQIRDDILGIWGLSEDTGKRSGNDILRRKKSLPIIFAFSNTTGTQHEQLLELYRSQDPITPEQEQFVIEVLDQCGARQYCQAQADQFKIAALTALEDAAGGAEALSHNIYLRQLHALSTFLVERNY